MMKRILTRDFLILLVFALAAYFLVLTSQVNAQFPSVKAPIAYWNLDETGPSFKIFDASGNGHNGNIWMSYKRVAGIKNNSVNFASTGFIQVNDMLNVGITGPEFVAAKTPLSPKKFTISAWINPDKYPDASVKFMSWILGNDKSGTDGVGGYALRLGVGANEAGKDKITFVWRGASGKLYQINSTKSIPLNKWTFVAVTLDENGQAKIYVNGSQEGGIVRSEPIKYYRYAPFFIGGRSQDFSYLWSGGLDEIKVYDYVRASSQINSDFLNP